MTRTVLAASDLKRRFPEFVDVDAAQVVFALEDAAREVGDWGDDANRAIMLLAAHFLVTQGALTESGAPSPAVVGPLTSKTLGDASESYGSKGGAAVATLSDSELMTTTYGARFIAIRRRCVPMVLTV